MGNLSNRPHFTLDIYIYIYLSIFLFFFSFVCQSERQGEEEGNAKSATSASEKLVEVWQAKKWFVGRLYGKPCHATGANFFFKFLYIVKSQVPIMLRLFEFKGE